MGRRRREPRVFFLFWCSPAKEAQDDDGDVFIIKPDEIPEIPANNFLMRRVPAEADSNFG